MCLFQKNYSRIDASQAGSFEGSKASQGFSQCRGAFAVLALVLLVAHSSGGLLWAQSPRLLTEIQSVRELSRDAVTRGIPVRLRGVVTLQDEGKSEFWLQDSTGGINVARTGTPSPLKTGQLVEVIRKTSSSDPSPKILSSAVNILGLTTLPEPKPLNLYLMQRGSQDAQWVQFEGVVREYNRTENVVKMTVFTSEGRVLLKFVKNGRPLDPKLYVDAEVQVRGVYVAEPDSGKLLASGFVFYGGPEFIERLVDPPLDPFSLPLQQIDALSPKP